MMQFYGLVELAEKHINVEDHTHHWTECTLRICKDPLDRPGEWCMQPTVIG